MTRNRKADLRGIGSSEKHLTGKSKRFFNADFSTGLENIASIFGRMIRCKFCGSDYMRFAVDGYCQRCQQLAEYVIRERPATAQRARASR